MTIWAEYLAAAIKVNKSLYEVKLSGNKVGNEWVETFVGALMSNKIQLSKQLRARQMMQESQH